MPGIFLAAPTFVPRPPGPVLTGLGVEWVGWDGTVWNLVDEASGVLLTPGVRGLSMPPVRRYTSVSPAVPGSRWRGQVALEREVFWPLFVYSNAGSQAWVEYDRAFWRTMHPEKTGVWRVTSPDGGTRTLRLRFVNDGDPSWDRDPVMAGWATYGITLVAEQPFWEGQLSTRTWAASAPVDFFGDGTAPAFHITSGSTLAGATMANPGDVDAYPVWAIRGATTSVSVGVGGRVIEVPFAVAADRLLVIDPRPTAQTAVEVDAPASSVAPGSAEWGAWLEEHLPAGTDRTADLGEVDFAPIPPGAAADLSLTMVGTGMVTASLTPLYNRTW